VFIWDFSLGVVSNHRGSCGFGGGGVEGDLAGEEAWQEQVAGFAEVLDLAHQNFALIVWMERYHKSMTGIPIL
jgi:hypothetical protein